MKYLIGVIALVLTAAACNDKPPARTVFDPQVKALEKARGVEKQVQQAAERRADDVESK